MHSTRPHTPHTPAYIQLYEQVKRDILQGAYDFGDRLPSKRTMANDRGVSTVTVEHAYRLLCEEGFVESRERSGFFVIFRQDDGFAAPAADDFSPSASRPSPTVFSSNSGADHSDPQSRPAESASSGFPLSVLAKTMRRVISDYGDALLDVSPNLGCTELRGAIGQHLARNRGIYVDIDQIVIGSGAEYLYSLIVSLLGHDRIFALESPSYEKIEQVYRTFGVVCELLPLRADGIDSSSLRQTRASVLHITPYRSFPTGITASASKRYEYLRWAELSDRFIVEDDFESEFAVSRKPEETLFSMTDRDNVIYLNTFSKTISPSLRVGYMVLPHRLVGTFSERLGCFSCTVPTFEQFVLAELIAQGDFERHINRVRRAKRKRLTKRIASV